MSLIRRNGINATDSTASFWDYFALNAVDTPFVRIEILSVYTSAKLPGIIAGEFYIGQGNISLV